MLSPLPSPLPSSLARAAATLRRLGHFEEANLITPLPYNSAALEVGRASLEAICPALTVQQYRQSLEEVYAVFLKEQEQNKLKEEPKEEPQGLPDFGINPEQYVGRTVRYRDNSLQEITKADRQGDGLPIKTVYGWHHRNGRYNVELTNGRDSLQDIVELLPL